MKNEGGTPFAPEREISYTRMSLRDYFAAAALQAICTEYFRANGSCVGMDHPYSNIPVLAYRMADAMPAERIK